MSKFRPVLTLLTILGLSWLAAPAVLAQQTTLTIYTAEEVEKLEPIRRAFRAQHPSIDIVWVRDSTGVITTRILAEIDAGTPRADLILGTGTLTATLVSQRGLALPYAPKGLDRLHPKFRDKRDPPHWVALESYQSAICFNKIEAAKAGLAPPVSWRDLTGPAYRGRIVMPNPNSSGTGLLSLFGWMKVFGEDEAWKFMDALHENMAFYTHSGSQPCSLAGTGEFVLGISYTLAGSQQKRRGAPIDILLPTEGVGSEFGASMILKSTRNPEAAKLFLDWYVSPDGVAVYNQFSPMLAMPEMAQAVEHFPRNVLEAMIENDPEWETKNRERVLAEWQRRYGSKSLKR